ncbi:hypothetical protein NIES22_71260 (plasmid) [Calothrix brevissima NIES-22]|nr:hypothetical protein NIES22_71260 [Calothrix brevissima NIES-22]
MAAPEVTGERVTAGFDIGRGVETIALGFEVATGRDCLTAVGLIVGFTAGLDVGEVLDAGVGESVGLEAVVGTVVVCGDTGVGLGEVVGTVVVCGDTGDVNGCGAGSQPATISAIAPTSTVLFIMYKYPVCFCTIDCDANWVGVRSQLTINSFLPSRQPLSAPIYLGHNLW